MWQIARGTLCALKALCRRRENLASQGLATLVRGSRGLCERANGSLSNYRKIILIRVHKNNNNNNKQKTAILGTAHTFSGKC